MFFHIINTAKLTTQRFRPELSLLPLIITSRQAHTDIKIPNFDKYRRDSLKDPKVRTSESEGSRKCFTYFLSAAACVNFLYGLKWEIIRDVMYMSASADVLALAKIEINLSQIPEGVGVTYKWRGKPLFIRHRTPQEIKMARSVNLAKLRHPEHDSDRAKDPNFLVTIGVCTHLGCVPMHDAGDYGPGGYYCPCHGSHFDSSGRIRKGPAPTNMEVPEYRILEDNTLIVG